MSGRANDGPKGHRRAAAAGSAAVAAGEPGAGGVSEWARPTKGTPLRRAGCAEPLSYGDEQAPRGNLRGASEVWRLAGAPGTGSFLRVPRSGFRWLAGADHIAPSTAYRERASSARSAAPAVRGLPGSVTRSCAFPPAVSTETRVCARATTSSPTPARPGRWWTRASRRGRKPEAGVARPERCSCSAGSRSPDAARWRRTAAAPGQAQFGAAELQPALAPGQVFAQFIVFAILSIAAIVPPLFRKSSRPSMTRIS